MNQFEVLSEIIKKRRTVKPAKMNGNKIPDEQVMQLLGLADWAPTHKHTEPWRFSVYSGDKAREFVSAHAELYKQSTPADSFKPEKYEKILGNRNNISHLVVCTMKRDDEKRVPEIEEISASAAAIQNILLGAASLNIAALWSTGGMLHSAEMKKFLNLSSDDKVMGVIYLGYTDFTFNGKRIIPLENKISWK